MWQLITLYKNVPNFPKKRYIGDNTSPKFVQQRCKHLSEYLNHIIQLPGILDVPEMRTFLMTTLSTKGFPSPLHSEVIHPLRLCKDEPKSREI